MDELTGHRHLLSFACDGSQLLISKLLRGKGLRCVALAARVVVVAVFELSVLVPATRPNHLRLPLCPKLRQAPRSTPGSGPAVHGYRDCEQAVVPRLRLSGVAVRKREES